MRIGLSTDFTDFYDFIFYPAKDCDKVWERNSTGGMNRREMLRFLEDARFKTPQHGLVKELAPTLIETAKREFGFDNDEIISTETNIKDALRTASVLDKDKHALDLAVLDVEKEMLANATMLVVYTDESAHRGEGKVRLSAREALSLYPDNYCTRYIHTAADSNAGFSLRILTIGDMNFIIEYYNQSDWRSNYGNDVQVAVTGRFDAKPNFLSPSPIFAIDFVKRADGDMFAIDFNVAPSLDPLKNKTDNEGNPYITATEIYEAVESFMEPTQCIS